MRIIRFMDLRAFDLNLLKVLDALLRERSPVRAGQAIGLSQPAVSAALSRLRAAFGDPLLVREGRSMQPTEFALNLAGPLADMLEDMSRLLTPMAFDPARADKHVSAVGSGSLHHVVAAAVDGPVDRSRPRHATALYRRDQPPHTRRSARRSTAPTSHAGVTLARLA